MVKMGDVPDVEHGKETEYVISPLVRRANKSADETGYDDHPCEECGDQDVGQCKAGREEEDDKEQWEGDEPLDVSHILQLQSVSRGNVFSEGK